MQSVNGLNPLSQPSTSAPGLPCLPAHSFPHRFLSQLLMVALPAISQAGFQAIFTDVVRRSMAASSTLPHALVGSLVGATLDLYRKVTAELLPSPARPHYVFSILHVAHVFQVGRPGRRGTRPLAR